MDSWAWNVSSSHSLDLELRPSPNLCPPAGANVPVERSVVADSRDHDHSVGSQLPDLANRQSSSDAILSVLTKLGGRAVLLGAVSC